ncbi:hypothetical protein RhiirA1_471168 [Rhizophagus irregularis]|uniref:Uncharacterized protein n=2 Tax=Rhizophagus irregularis TaxID=588596 RepID=A0A2I1FAH1_9GLOM|nr:hypothetical protein RhiirA1_471168 [Rhizophagus irregularis]PKY31370.1 hypothetical protein RhiirB3_448942 [Rhizophagus irregularis]
MPKVNTAKKTLKNAFLPKEITEYPKSNSILYTNGRRSYYYIVKQEGLYPQPSILAYAQGKNKYKIPDNYCVETTWGRSKNKRTVKCLINYIEGKPLYKIMYDINFAKEVQSDMSLTAVANMVLKKLFPNNEKSLISGVHLFGIHLTILKQTRESYNQLKPLEFCSKSTVNKRQHKFGEKLKEQIQLKGEKIYGKDQVILKNISYSVNHMNFQIDYCQKDNEEIKKLTSLVRAVDQNHISREGYRAITAIDPNLEREWALSN